MAVHKLKPKSTSGRTVTINKHWQLAFVVSTVVGQLLLVLSIGASLYGHGRYTSRGTWWFEIIQFLYPAFFAGAGYVFVRKRVLGLLAQLFWALLLTVMAVALYQGMLIPINHLMSVLHLYPSGSDAHYTWWNTYGLTWLPLVGVFIVYCLTLTIVSRKRVSNGR